MTNPMTPNSPERLASAYDRGDSAAYYGRRSETPNISLRTGPTLWDRVDLKVTDMTPKEIVAFYRGERENPSGEKDWF